MGGNIIYTWLDFFFLAEETPLYSENIEKKPIAPDKAFTLPIALYRYTVLIPVNIAKTNKLVKRFK